MKKSSKSFEKLVEGMTPITESQKGVLKGGLSSFQIETELTKEKNKNGCVNVNCSGANCDGLN